MTAPEPTPAQTPEPATGTEPQEPAQPTTPDPKPSETLEFWKAQARKQEERAKANADAAAELQKIKDANKSELERANEAAAKSAAELAAARAENAPLAKGIPADLIPPSSNAPDDIAAYADRLLAWRTSGAAQPVTPAGPSNPKPDPGQGQITSAEATSETEVQAYLARINPYQIQTR